MVRAVMANFRKVPVMAHGEVVGTWIGPIACGDRLDYDELRADDESGEFVMRHDFPLGYSWHVLTSEFVRVNDEGLPCYYVVAIFLDLEAEE